MRRSVAILAVLLSITSSAFAGEIFGKIVADGSPVPEGTTVEIQCGGKPLPATKTGKAGAYHAAVEATGKCVLTVKHKDQAAAVEVASYDEPVQVDIVLETKDGKLTARRK